ncbi:Zinc finger BED domain-containing protein 5 [Trichinella britovi]|uniref:Zinc finger BED domain-containing protein 5 n=1 Tax=Trichinella britovi TaxID=45882 RepID=A0A0V1D6H6_TRIBR|nr:Zinc finger BED domain-containing protein 5 [Trichinella britovi]
MCLIERSRHSLSRRAQYASALCRSLGMDEWLIRNPVKREVAEMEFQKGSTAGDVNNKRKIYENESANFQLSNRRKPKVWSFIEVLHDEKFVLKLTYLVDICSKLNELNLYLQGMDAADIFSTLATFIVKKEATPDEDLISMIVSHLDSLKESFDYYFSEEVKFCDKNIWIVNPFQSDVVATGISTKADEKLIDLSKDYSFKMSFDRKRLIQFGYQYKTHIQLFPPQH